MKRGAEDQANAGKGSSFEGKPWEARYPFWQLYLAVALLSACPILICVYLFRLRFAPESVGQANLYLLLAGVVALFGLGVGRKVIGGLIRQLVAANNALEKHLLEQKKTARDLRAELSDRQKMQEGLRKLAMVDELTGFYNRLGFIKIGGGQIELAQALKRGFYLIVIGLDELKNINTDYGKREGERALTQIADILRASFRVSDTIARLRDDEFVIIAMKARRDSAQILADRCDRVLKFANKQNARPYHLSFNLGFSYFNPRNPVTLETLIDEADSAMSKNKKGSQSPQTVRKAVNSVNAPAMSS